MLYEHLGGFSELEGLAEAGSGSCLNRSFLLSHGLCVLLVLLCVYVCVQLYLNYKLQSVAHLPWRQMTYKFLNTIIDDLFAFVIKMPLLHRISVFRWARGVANPPE